MTTFTVAVTDYFAIAGASSTTTVKAPSTIPAGYFYVYPNASPNTNLSGASGAKLNYRCTAGRYPDGLSNTVMISEMAGRPCLYLAAGKQVLAANFPSYVSAGSVDACAQYPAELRLGRLGP